MGDAVYWALIAAAVFSILALRAAPAGVQDRGRKRAAKRLS
jgi:hypothetical protein